MKTDINVEGTMTISAETPLEGYALRRWCEENIDSRGVFNADNILIKAWPKKPDDNGGES